MPRYIDAVSKAEVLETYAELYDVFDDNREIKKELHKVYDKLNALPTADVRENVYAHWIRIGRGFAPDTYVCSACKKESRDYGNFCQNCGADMRGNENGKGNS